LQVAALLARAAALTVVVEAAILKAPGTPMEVVLVEPFVLSGALAALVEPPHSHQPMLALNFWKNR
jgi:hypothetical protein